MEGATAGCFAEDFAKAGSFAEDFAKAGPFAMVAEPTGGGDAAGPPKGPPSRPRGPVASNVAIGELPPNGGSELSKGTVGGCAVRGAFGSNGPASAPSPVTGGKPGKEKSGSGALVAPPRVPPHLPRGQKPLAAGALPPAAAAAAAAAMAVTGLCGPICPMHGKPRTPQPIAPGKFIAMPGLNMAPRGGTIGCGILGASSRAGEDGTVDFFPSGGLKFT